jgi:hypothetical protein
VKQGQVDWIVASVDECAEELVSWAAGLEGAISCGRPSLLTVIITNRASDTWSPPFRKKREKMGHPRS